MDPGIMCFQHCNTKIFSIYGLEKCPVCNVDLEKMHLQDLPFRIPYPFVRANQYPRSVLIKPTSGDFLNDYCNSIPLHIGVTTARGIIVEFSQHGLQQHSSKNDNNWQQCLLLQQIPVSWSDHWDQTLDRICKKPCWTNHSYNENSFNCYTFVLQFVSALDFGELSRAAQNTAHFCHQFILPKTASAAKYISLYRRLKQNSFVVQNVLG